MTPIVATLLNLLGAIGLSAGPQRPPSPDFDKPADYVAWFRGFVGDAGSCNGFDEFRLIRPDAAGHGGIPSPKARGKRVAEAVDRIFKAGPVWTAAERPELAAYINDCRKHLDALNRSVQCPNFRLPPPAPNALLFTRRTEQMPHSRTAVKALLTRSWIKQPDQARAMLDAWRVALRHAAHLQQIGTLHDGVIPAPRLRRWVYSAMTAAVRRGVLRGEALPAAYDLLRECDPRPMSLGPAMTIEWAAQLQAVQVLCPGGRFDPARHKMWNDRTGVDLFSKASLADPPAMVERINRAYGEAIRIADGPLSLENWRRFERHFENAAVSAAGAPGHATLLRTYTRPYFHLLRCEARRRGTLLVLALHIHRQRHGTWPEKLDELDLPGIASARTDPFSGRPFRYRLRPAGPLLYTVAVDGKDDGGKHADNWGLAGWGGDFVIYPPP